MAQLECTSEEADVLQQVLQHRLAALEVEIHHTDHAEFRRLLRHRRDVLHGLMGKLAATTGVGMA
jgi:hypothetical protein